MFLLIGIILLTSRGGIFIEVDISGVAGTGSAVEVDCDVGGIASGRDICCWCCRGKRQSGGKGEKG